jgi:hypothetical protein
VTYEIEPAWRFVSKQIAVLKAPTATSHVNEVHVFRDELIEAIADRYVPRSSLTNPGTSDYGVFLRFADARGLLARAGTVTRRVLRERGDGVSTQIGWSGRADALRNQDQYSGLKRTA